MFDRLGKKLRGGGIHPPLPLYVRGLRQVSWPYAYDANESNLLRF